MRNAPSAMAHQIYSAWIVVHIPILKLRIHLLTKSSSAFHARIFQLIMISINHHTMTKRSNVMRCAVMASIWVSMNVMTATV